MRRFWGLCSQYVDTLLSEKVLGGGKEHLFQARLVTLLILIIQPVCTILLLIDFKRGAYEYASITLAFMIFCGLCLWFLKRTGRYQLTAILLCSIPIFTLTRAALQEEGLVSMYVPLLLVIPSLGFLMARLIGGFFLTGLILASLTVLLFHTPAEPHQVNRYSILVFATLLWTACALTFYKVNSTARRKVESANHTLDALNKKLEQETQKLQHALEINEEILSITAHELKNPLGGIIGLADIVLEDHKEHPALLEESVLENLPIIRKEAEHVLKIVKDLLDKHRLGQQPELKKSQLLINEIISTVIRWNTVQMEKKGIRIHSSIPSNILIQADEDAILRVLDNYVSNAIKYSPEGTEIRIEVNTTLAENESTPNPMVKVVVIDEGPGLTEEDKRNVFGKMKRLSAKPTAGEHSTGLGLYIVKSLIEEQGGVVGVESEYGQGARFWFALPQAHSLN